LTERWWTCRSRAFFGKRGWRARKKNFYSLFACLNLQKNKHSQPLEPTNMDNKMEKARELFTKCINCCKMICTHQQTFFFPRLVGDEDMTHNFQAMNYFCIVTTSSRRKWRKENYSKSLGKQFRKGECWADGCCWNSGVMKVAWQRKSKSFRTHAGRKVRKLESHHRATTLQKINEVMRGKRMESSKSFEEKN
jgi:hypothetical protein